jgi:hypothetical protein
LVARTIEYREITKCRGDSEEVFRCTVIDAAIVRAFLREHGHESVPSFVTMFRKALGTSPGHYMAERHFGAALV